MADAAGVKMVDSWFDWEEHFLDVLLFFWIFWSLMIVAIVNMVLTFFGPLQPRISWDKSREGTSSATVVAQHHGPESTFWLNSMLNWAYLHYNNFPEFVDVWVHALNDQATKLGGPVQLKFEKVNSGSLPPKFGEVTFDSGPEDKYVVDCRVDSRDLSFAIFASQQTHEGVKLTNLTINILRLRGHLKIKCYRENNDMMANISFVGRPDIKVAGKPVNPYQDPSDLVDIGVTEEVVRNAICLTSTTFNVSKWITGPLDTIPITRTLSSESARSQDKIQPPGSPRHGNQQVFEPIEMQESKVQQQQPSAFQSLSHSPQARGTPQRVHQRVPQDKRLLVKVIKASGIKQTSTGGVDPYCVVYVDTPPQSELTSTVRSTYNPFWDEQFFFDLNRNSQEIRFEVLDKRRKQNENFLGEAIVYCEDLVRNPSSRQIIPLQGQTSAGDLVSGSITVELLCMQPDGSEHVSPRRTIETSKQMTSGGTMVTTTTMTTQRPQNSRYQAGVDGSPNYVEKREFDYDSADPHAFYPTHIPTIESSPTDDSYDGHMVMSGPESPEMSHPPPKEKKKGFAAQIRKRFSRSKKRSSSADRASSLLREGSNYLRPPEHGYGPQSKDRHSSLEDSDASSSIFTYDASLANRDDIDLHRRHPEDDHTPNLKKSRSLGSSLKKLFRRSSRKRSRSIGRGDQSRESSISRQSRQEASREGSLNRAGEGSLNRAGEGSLNRATLHTPVSYDHSQQETMVL